MSAASETIADDEIIIDDKNNTIIPEKEIKLSEQADDVKDISVTLNADVTGKLTDSTEKISYASSSHENPDILEVHRSPTGSTCSMDESEQVMTSDGDDADHPEETPHDSVLVSDVTIPHSQINVQQPSLHEEKEIMSDTDSPKVPSPMFPKVADSPTDVEGSKSETIESDKDKVLEDALPESTGSDNCTDNTKGKMLEKSSDSEFRPQTQEVPDRTDNIEKENENEDQRISLISLGMISDVNMVEGEVSSPQNVQDEQELKYTGVPDDEPMCSEELFPVIGLASEDDPYTESELFGELGMAEDEYKSDLPDSLVVTSTQCLSNVESISNSASGFDAVADKAVTEIPEKPFAQILDKQLTESSSNESQEKSEKASFSVLSEDSVAFTQQSISNSTSNSVDGIVPGDVDTSENHENRAPSTVGSLPQTGTSIPASLADTHDTESTNMSSVSASTSTTQPLDMGEIVQVHVEPDDVFLPPSNVTNGSDAGQNAVDEWCSQQAESSEMKGTRSGETSNNLHTDKVAQEYEEAEFDWEEYLEDTSSTAAPHTAFPHVEASLRSNFEKGMKFEMPHGDPTKYWIATVVMPCGQLLRLRYDGYDEDSAKDFWSDAFTSDIHPLGWCKQNSKIMEPPQDVAERLPEWQKHVETTLQQATTASDTLLGGGLGSAAVDQIKQGMLVEVQHDMDHTRVWIARILENIGGRLLLRYEGTDWARQDFWLFYLHYRLHPMGWGTDMELEYGPPEVVADEWSRDEGWKAVLEKAQHDTNNLPFPADILADQELCLEHTMKEGWKFEALHPGNQAHICPATVIQVYSDMYFLVRIDDLEPSLDDAPVQMCCHGGSRNIFPVDWSRRNNINLLPPNGWNKEFSWSEYLAEVQAEAAPDEAFCLDCGDIELTEGRKLEAASSERPGQICVATVTQVCSPLVCIHLERSVDAKSYHMVDCQSQELFPVGWCDSNNYPLKPPHRSFYIRKQAQIIVHAEPSSNSSHSKPTFDRGSSWCPKIYFNHRCFSGPFLSKGRIAELPKCVGPGPVTLVMKEVLSMLINVAYKSSRVLRELQLDGPPNPNLHQQVLKAKYKGKSYRAMVDLCKTSDQVLEFCKTVCVKLECCPYLFNPVFINGQCPQHCSQQSKTKYTTYFGKRKKVGRPPGGHTNLEGGARKPGKRRKRKRLPFIKVKKSSSNADTALKDEDYDELESMLHEESSNSTVASLDFTGNDDSPRRKRKYTRHVAPPLEMKTRGVKLPRYGMERRARQPRTLAEATGDQELLAKPIKEETPTKKARFLSQSNKSAFDVTEPVKEEDALMLATNPLYWTVREVVEYVLTTDSAPLARLIKNEDIDGQSLMLLTLPTVQELMEVKLGPAIKLCSLVEKIKIAFFEQFTVLGTS